MHRRVTLSGLVLALLLGPFSAAVAQDPSGPPARAGAAHDSADAGRVAGAARGERVGGYFTPALLSGLPIGAVGPIAAGEARPDVPPVVVTAAGVAGVIGISLHAAHAGVTLPAPAEAQLREHDVSYQRAFRDAYVKEVQRRRAHAALWGGVTGTAVGVGAFLLLLTHIKT